MLAQTIEAGCRALRCFCCLCMQIGVVCCVRIRTPGVDVEASDTIVNVKATIQIKATIQL